MEEILIKNDILIQARQKAREMGAIKNSITRGGGNVAGFVGELVCLDLLPLSKINNTYDHDIDFGKFTIDVKTKRTNYKPKDYYDCSVASSSKHQRCSHYIFTRVLNDFSSTWILGWMTREEYFDAARFLKKGEEDGDNGFVVKADCYNVPIKDLYDISLLK